MARSVLKAAGYACAAWIIYGIVEVLLSSMRIVWNRQAEVTVWEWRLIPPLLAAYGVIGIVLGTLAGLVLSRRDKRHEKYQIAAALTIALSCAANLAAAPSRNSSEYLTLAASILVSAALLFVLITESWSKWLIFLASPFTVALLLLSAPWARREFLQHQPSRVLNAILAVLIFVGVLSCAAFVFLLKRRRIGSPSRQTLTAVALLVPLAIPGLLHHRVAAATASLPGNAKPNILLITLDTVRTDHLPFYGYGRDTAPNLSAFAKAATLYSRAYATSDFTLPAHASIFTGLYPGWFGPIFTAPPRQMAVPLEPGHTMLAEALREHGYWTVESVANYAYLAPEMGLTKGFMVSEWTQPVPFSNDCLRDWLSPYIGPAAIERPFHNAAAIGRRGRLYLQQAAASSQPLFLFLNFMDAHFPYVSDPEFDGLFLAGQPHFSPSTDLSSQVNAGKRALLQKERTRLLDQYDGGIASEDSELARLFAELRDLGLYDNTLIAISSDHGEGFLEHGIMDHAQGFVYENYIHVPLLIKYPGQREGAQSAALVSEIDIMPTILDIAGVTVPPDVQGLSLRRKGRAESDAVFAQAEASAWSSPNRKLHGTRRAILSGQMKLIAWSEGAAELYDLAADPAEEHDLYDPDDPRAAALSKRLADWSAAQPKPPIPKPKMDNSVLERLKSLGYTQ
jgi:arylsulfatase A-like enzyme